MHAIPAVAAVKKEKARYRIAQNAKCSGTLSFSPSSRECVYERVRGVRMCMCICVPPLLDVFSILSLGK